MAFSVASGRGSHLKSPTLTMVSSRNRVNDMGQVWGVTIIACW